MPEPAEDNEFLLVGGDAALDLLNTTPVLAAGPVDLLTDFAALARWMQAAGLITPAQLAHWRRRWEGTREGARALAESKQLRGDLLQIVMAVASGQAVRNDWLQTLNTQLQRAPMHSKIEWNANERSFVRADARDESRVGIVVLLVAEAIAQLLTEKDLSHVHKCENPKCVLWFYDTSRNHTRRWCSMDLCGNRAKVAAHYRRGRRRRHPARAE